MLHVVKMIRRRYPNQSNRIVGSAVLLSASALLIGAFLLFIQ